MLNSKGSLAGDALKILAVLVLIILTIEFLRYTKPRTLELSSECLKEIETVSKLCELTFEKIACEKIKYNNTVALCSWDSFSNRCVLSEKIRENPGEYFSSCR